MRDVLLVSALIGTTLIVVRSTIFRPVRRFFSIEFLRCSQCVGLWIGVFASLGGLLPMGHGRLLDAVIVGTANSFLALLSDALLIHFLGDPLDDNEPLPKRADH